MPDFSQAGYVLRPNPMGDTLKFLANERNQQNQFNQRLQLDNKELTLRAVNSLYDQFNYEKYMTGVPAFDAAAKNEFDRIENEGLKRMIQDPVAGKLWINAQTIGLGMSHKLLLDKKNREEADIANMVKQDPNLDEAALRNDMYGQLNNLAANNIDKTTGFPNLTTLPQTVWGTPIASTLGQDSRYQRSITPLLNIISNQKPEQVTIPQGNNDIIFYGDRFHDVAPYDDKTGKFTANNWRNTVAHSEDIPLDPSDPNGRVIKVLPNEDYNYLLSAVPNGAKMMDKAFNDMAMQGMGSGAPSILYTDPGSPYYQRTDNWINDHPAVKDMAKRWLARNYVEQLSPARAYTKPNADAIWQKHNDQNFNNAIKILDYKDKIHDDNNPGNSGGNGSNWLTNTTAAIQSGDVSAMKEQMGKLLAGNGKYKYSDFDYIPDSKQIIIRYKTGTTNEPVLNSKGRPQIDATTGKPKTEKKDVFKTDILSINDPQLQSKLGGLYQSIMGSDAKLERYITNTPGSNQPSNNKTPDKKTIPGF